MLLALIQEAAGHAPAAAEGGHAAVTPFSINPGLIIWTLVVFGILMLLLAKTAWPAILKAVEEREQRMKADLAAAAAANAEAQRLLAEYQQQLAAAKAEATDIVASGRAAGEKIREEIVSKARVEQEGLLERARREIGMEKDRAVAELRREAVELSIAAASKVLEKNLDTEADRKIVTDFLAGLPSSKA